MVYVKLCWDNWQALLVVTVTVPLEPEPDGTTKAELDMAKGILNAPVVVQVKLYELAALASKRT